jgi:uncharacterized membrane protein YqhA
MVSMSKILRLRYIFIIVSIFSFISCLFFIGVGISESIHAFKIVIGAIGGGVWENPGILLVEALDRFLIAVLFYIFGIGMIKLFLPELFKDADLPKWLDIKDIRQLKVLLWETILVTLVVLSVTSMVGHTDSLSWDVLILPSVIAVLSLSLFLMRSKVDSGPDDH